MSPIPCRDLSGGFTLCAFIIGLAHLNPMCQCRRKCLVGKVESVLNILDASQHAYLNRCPPSDEILQSLQATPVSICPIVDQEREHGRKPIDLHVVHYLIKPHRRRVFYLPDRYLVRIADVGTPLLTAAPSL